MKTVFNALSRTLQSVRFHIHRQQSPSLFHLNVSHRSLSSKDSYFDWDDRDRIVERAKYRKRAGDRGITLRDIAIPQTQIRQFIKLVHPDRFEAFISKNESESMMYSADQLRSMQQVNQRNLSKLNAILEFSRKHSRMINSELFDHKNKEQSKVIGDRKMTQNAPNPELLEFYIEKHLEQIDDQRTGVYFEHFHVRFECKETRPMISEYFKALHTTLNGLFQSGNIETKSGDDGSRERVKKFSDLEIDRALRLANSGDEEAQSEVFKQHLSSETEMRNKEYGVNAMKHKFESKQVFFAATLKPEHMEAAVDMLYKVSGEFAIDLVFKMWVEIPIYVCQTEMDCLKCPDYVVAIPWYCDPEEFVLYIQDQIVTISKNHRLHQSNQQRAQHRQWRS